MTTVYIVWRVVRGCKEFVQLCVSEEVASRVMYSLHKRDKEGVFVSSPHLVVTEAPKWKK